MWCAGDRLEYGPFSDIAAFASAPLSVQFENEHPFVTMVSARKLIEVSHFGNINVEEQYVLQHTGAKLRGSFSRFDYQNQNQRGGGAGKGSNFRSLNAYLPARATNIYYRDAIGNISTSAVQHHRTHTHIELQPRFPMFGGWQTDFYIGYDVPAADYLSVDAADPARYVLNFSFAMPFPQAACDELEVQVILPELASDIRYAPPSPPLPCPAVSSASLRAARRCSALLGAARRCSFGAVRWVRLTVHVLCWFVATVG